MAYLEIIRRGSVEPERLEVAFHEAAATGQTAEFAKAIEAEYAAEPDNVLWAAWHYRLTYALAGPGEGRAIAWGWAILLAVINGALLWLLSAERFMLEPANTPGFFLTWAPVSAVCVLIFLVVAGSLDWARVVVISIGLLALTLYALRAIPWLDTMTFQEQYTTLMALHLPLLAWSSVGIALLWRQRDYDNRFAFLLKSLEIFVVGGVFAIAVGLFVAITAGLFEALNIELTDAAMRALVMGIGGLLPVLTIAIVYDPTLSPARQSVGDGMSKLVATILRVLLPLTLLVLVIYIAFIPFNFQAPFENRDVLIVYSAMLFAVVALLTGVTPAPSQTLAPAVARWLRWGMLAVAALALLVGLYAFAAIGYRTWEGGWTPNRLTFIGWNAINLGILAGALAGILRGKGREWPRAMRGVLSVGMVAYVVWVVWTIVGLPLVF